MAISFPHKTLEEYSDAGYNALGLFFFVPCHFVLVEEPDEPNPYLLGSKTSSSAWVSLHAVEANWVPEPLLWLTHGLATIMLRIAWMIGIQDPYVPIIVLKQYGPTLTREEVRKLPGFEDFRRATEEE